MHLRRSLPLSLSVLALCGTAFATSENQVKRVKTASYNCAIGTQKHHYKSKDSCEKAKGSWLGDNKVEAANIQKLQLPSAAASTAKNPVTAKNPSKG